MSFARRSTSEGILDDISEQTKPTGIPFVCYEEILMTKRCFMNKSREQMSKIYGTVSMPVLEYASTV